MADSDVGWVHADAIHDMLTDATSYPVYIGEVTADAGTVEYPYLVVWPPAGSRPTTTLAGYGGEASTRTQITAAGLTVRDVITALDRASAALHRKRPLIVGRHCGLITQTPEAAGPPQPDKDPTVRHEGLPVYFSFAQFTLFSAPLVAPEDDGS